MTDICKEYAAALFMLSQQDAKTAEFSEALKLISRLVDDNPDYLTLLDSPAILLSERLSLIDSAFADAVPEYVLSFLKLMCENGHISILPECISEFDGLAKSALNCAGAVVYYVKEPDAAQKAALVKKLSDITGKTVDPIYIEDKSLIGGIKIEIDGKTLDGSITGRLNKIKGVMSK